MDSRIKARVRCDTDTEIAGLIRIRELEGRLRDLAKEYDDHVKNSTEYTENAVSEAYTAGHTKGHTEGYAGGYTAGHADALAVVEMGNSQKTIAVETPLLSSAAERRAYNKGYANGMAALRTHITSVQEKLQVSNSRFDALYGVAVVTYDAYRDVVIEAGGLQGRLDRLWSTASLLGDTIKQLDQEKVDR